MSDLDFNDNQQSPAPQALIPEGTKAKIKVLEVLQSQDLGDYVFKNINTGSEYLKLKLLVELPNSQGVNPIMYQMFGIAGKGGNPQSNWAITGRSLVRQIIEAAHRISPDDNSSNAVNKRKLQSAVELEGLQFYGIIGIEKASSDQYADKNIITEVCKFDSLDDPIPF